MISTGPQSAPQGPDLSARGRDFEAVGIHTGRFRWKLQMEPISLLLEHNLRRRTQQGPPASLEIARSPQRVNRQVPVRWPAQSDRIQCAILRREANILGRERPARRV